MNLFTLLKLFFLQNQMLYSRLFQLLSLRVFQHHGYLRHNATMLCSNSKSIKNLLFDNRAIKNLPLDEIKENYVRSVKDACFSLVNPTPIKNPRLVSYSPDALQLLDLSDSSIDDYFIRCFAGNEIIPGSVPAAHCYCGHQFGSFAGQLGDGAAIYLGEIINSKNERWELQLKGAGMTPYSREADGRKVLRSSIREYLCSEAMYYLGIPTTRSATCIVGEDRVKRDMFYDGNAKMEQCAVISRIAPSFLRFGSFEIFKPIDPTIGRGGPSIGKHDILAKLTDFSIRSYFTEIDSMDIVKEEKYKLFFKEVVIKTAKLVAQWQAVGFCHSVLNTDNMSILGLTIDYGPFGFLDVFDKDHVANTSDDFGRYRFQNQPNICYWNLNKFAEALKPLVPLEELQAILKENFYQTYKKDYLEKMLKKFGLTKNISSNNDEDLTSDEELIDKFLETLSYVGADFTNCFRSLSILSLPGLPDYKQSVKNLKSELMKNSSSLDEMNTYYEKFISSPMVYRELILFQNFQDQLHNDQKTISILFKIQHYKHLQELNSEQFHRESEDFWDTWIQMYIKRLKYEIKDIEHNIEELEKMNQERKKLMNSNNPRIVLRNYLAQEAIKQAEAGDFSETEQLLSALKNPYSNLPQFDKYTLKPSKSFCEIRLSCSS